MEFSQSSRAREGESEQGTVQCFVRSPLWVCIAPAKQAPTLMERQHQSCGSPFEIALHRDLSTPANPSLQTGVGRAVLVSTWVA